MGGMNGYITPPRHIRNLEPVKESGRLSNVPGSGEDRPQRQSSAGPLAPNPLATRGAVVSMPAARSGTPGYPPDRTQLDDPMPLSACVAEVAQLLLTRES